MNIGKLITRIEEVEESNQIQINDIIKELEQVIFLKNQNTKKVFISAEDQMKDIGLLNFYKIKVISLISTL